VFRGLAIAMVLAMVGMAVMPLAVGELAACLASQGNEAGAAGSALAGAGSAL